MTGYIVQRLLQAVVVLWGVSLIVFFLLRLAPSDPITLLLTETATPQQIAEARHALGFDQPIYVQYGLFMERALQGDLAQSLFYKEPSLGVIMRTPLVTVMGLPITSLLCGCVISEQVFAWPGVGSVASSAISSRDYPIVKASVLVVSTAFVLMNLFVDVLYAWLDPRIRMSG